MVHPPVSLLFKQCMHLMLMGSLICDTGAWWRAGAHIIGRAIQVTFKLLHHTLWEPLCHLLLFSWVVGTLFLVLCSNYMPSLGNACHWVLSPYAEGKRNSKINCSIFMLIIHTRLKVFPRNQGDKQSHFHWLQRAWESGIQIRTWIVLWLKFRIQAKRPKQDQNVFVHVKKWPQTFLTDHGHTRQNIFGKILAILNSGTPIKP